MLDVFQNYVGEFQYKINFIRHCSYMVMNCTLTWKVLI